MVAGQALDDPGGREGGMKVREMWTVESGKGVCGGRWGMWVCGGRWVSEGV